MSLAPAILAASDAIPPAAAVGDRGWAGLILLLPLCSMIACAAMAMLRVRSKLPAVVTALAIAGSFATVLALAFRPDPGTPITIHLFDWIRFDWTAAAPAVEVAGETLWRSVTADFGFYVDSLTVFWMLFVTGLGTLIAIYASEYMESDRGVGYCRFFFGVSLFLLAMSCLVMADNLVLLYLGWEGVGLASYLLIGYYYQRPAAVAAAKKAFIMNRIGDAGLALGIFLIWVNYGSVEFSTLFAALEQPVSGSGSWDAAAIPFCLMIGAFGKSAQIPLFTWLPDAMEGPTPVSALIHAATMVTAGIYLIARTYPFFVANPDAMEVVAWIGALTALVAATIAMGQHDIKRVFAYSTVSQLGYMFLGLGSLASFGAAFHVFTHAFFKATLFLAAGAVMHGFAGQLDLRKISGLRHMPGWRVVAWTMFVGCLWLAAFPFTSAFFSKDYCIEGAFLQNTPSYRAAAWIGLFAGGLTAYYSFRVWFRVCCGPKQCTPGEEFHGDGQHGHDSEHGHGHGHGTGDHDGGFHPHAPRLAINGVLIAIALGAVLSGIPGYLALAGGENAVQQVVAGSSARAGSMLGDGGDGVTVLGMHPHLGVMVAGGIASLVGIALAWWFHLARRQAASDLRTRLLAHPAIRWLPTAIDRKWYFDEIYHALATLPAWGASHAMHLADRHLIDGVLVNGLGRIPPLLGRLFQPLYSGRLQGYAVTMAGGVALILLWAMWSWIAGDAS
jgi:NADH-quinone oxidoreductase subunit L